jgi:hypothetical protein
MGKMSGWGRIGLAEVALCALVGILAIGGCAGTEQTIDAAVQVTTSPVFEVEPTEEMKPERVVSATPSAAPTVAPTPTAPLGSAPYYLAYAKDIEGGVELVVADPEGGGRRGYPVPVELKGLPLDLNGVSPRGEYFAYHTGDLDDTRSDLTLHIMRLADEEEVFSARLTTEDLAERLEALGEELATSEPDALTSAFLAGVTAEEAAESAWGALQAGIRAVDWSPDGQLLAFAGQIDGATSDVYTFDVTTGDVRRLTDGPSQVQYVDWSPDGRWIAHGSAFWVGMGNYMINNFVSRDGTRVVTMDVGGTFGNEWYGSDWYLVHSAANGPGEYGLQMISPGLGEARMLWELPFSGYALDLPDGVLLVNQMEVMDPERQRAGTYLLDLERGTRERIGEAVQWLTRWPKAGELGLMHSSEGVLAVDVSGASRLLLEGEYGFPDPSPNGGEIAFSGYRDVEGLRVLEVASGEKMTLDVPGVTCVSWMPDEEALAFLADDALYFNDLRGNPSVLVDATPQHSYWNYVDCNVVWLEGEGG